MLTVEMSMLSIRIRPDDGRVVARSESANVLFPEPVRPMSAVVDPPLMVREIFCSAGSRCGAYWIVTFSNTMSPPSVGQYAGGSTDPGVSCSKWSSSTIRSTETKSIWSWPYILQRPCVAVTNFPAADRTKAVNPGDTPVKSASEVKMNVEHAERASKRYISQA